MSASWTRQQKRAQPVVDVIENARLRSGDRVNAIGLKHLAVVREPLKHEWNQRSILLSSDLGKETFETACVDGSIVGRNAHAGDHDFRAGFAAGRDDRNQVAGGFFKRFPTQAMVPAE